MKVKILITGSSGFIGKNLLLSLPKGWDVIALYGQSSTFTEFLAEKSLDHIRALACDLTNEADTQALAERIGRRFDACIYLAANGNPALSTSQTSWDLRLNVLGLIHFLTTFEIRRFIFLSSGAVYDGSNGLISPQTPVSPKLPYAISKFAAEQYIQHFADQGRLAEYIILRFFGAYGPYEPDRKIFTRLIRSFFFEAAPSFTIRGDGQNLIDAMYIDDAIQGILKILGSRVKNKVVDFCSGRSMTIHELVKTTASHFGIPRVEIRHEGTVPEYIRFFASTDLMQDYFGFQPRISLTEGFERLTQFLKQQEGIRVSLP